MEPHWVSYRDVVDPKIDVVVSSFGGVMSSTLIKWIKKYKNTNAHGNTDNLKHALYPPVGTNPNLRLVYIFDDPILAVLSLFRQQSLYKPTSLYFKMRRLIRTIKSGPLVFVEQHYWHMSREHRQWFQKKGKLWRGLDSLEAYLRSDFGALPLRQQFQNWQMEPTLHPVLFVRASTIWNHLDTLRSFLDLPEEAIKESPPKKERHVSFKDLDPPMQEKLQQLYGDFAEEIRRMPDVEIRPAKWFTHTPD